jgi:Fe2+ transport system protein FeoA
MDATELRRDVTLADCLTGTAWRVSATGEPHAASLARIGVVRGARVEIESRAPFGGPLVVRVGRSRVAIPRAIGRGIWVTAVA